VQAVDAVQRGVRSGALAPGDVTPRLLHACMHTSDCPDVDLLIRTSGETRLSDFLLWQAARAQLAFVDTLWPAFAFGDFARCVLGYQRHAHAHAALRRAAEAGAAAAAAGASACAGAGAGGGRVEADDVAAGAPAHAGAGAGARAAAERCNGAASSSGASGAACCAAEVQRCEQCTDAGRHACLGPGVTKAGHARNGPGSAAGETNGAAFCGPAAGAGVHERGTQGPSRAQAFLEAIDARRRAWIGAHA
jgi:hypothetical protein